MERAAMKRLVLPIAVILVLAVCVAIAGDFWASKKFSTWSDEETKKIMDNSPWARQVPVKYIYKGGGPGGMGGPGGFGGGMPPGGMGGGMGGGGGDFGPLMAPKPDMTPKATLRWQTALPVKQALARAKYKDKVETSEEAAKSLAREESQYILGISGLMGPPSSFDKNSLKTVCTLKIGDLAPIPPSDVVVDRQGMMTVLYVAFPKIDQGSHKISADDKDVEFILKAPTMELKAKFSLKDMVYQGKLEI
jgi:hypothetical protein